MYIAGLGEAQAWLDTVGGWDPVESLEERIRADPSTGEEQWWRLLVLSEAAALEHTELGIQAANAAVGLLPSRADAEVHYTMAVLGTLSRDSWASWTLLRAAKAYGERAMQPLWMADTLRRLSYAAMNFGRPAFAWFMADLALKQLELHAQLAHSVGCGHLARSYVQWATGDVEGAVVGYTRALGMLDPEIGFPVCFMGAQSLAEAIGGLQGAEMQSLARVGEHLERLRRCCPFDRDSSPALFLDWATARWLARRGDYDGAVELLDFARAGFRGCRSEDWLSATLDLVDAHLRREDVAAVTRITWDLKGEMVKDRHSWAAPVSSAVSVFCGSVLGASPTRCEIRNVFQDLRGAVGRRGLLV